MYTYGKLNLRMVPVLFPGGVDSTAGHLTDGRITGGRHPQKLMADHRQFRQAKRCRQYPMILIYVI